MERKTVEHLLKRPCFIDSSRRPRSAPILLGYEPSYKSFLSEPIVKDSRQAEVTVSRPGRDQEEIIQAVPLTARRGVQIPQLVTPRPQLCSLHPTFRGWTSGYSVPLSLWPQPKFEWKNACPKTIHQHRIRAWDTCPTATWDFSPSPSSEVLLRGECYEEKKEGRRIGWWSRGSTGIVPIWTSQS